jgi:hypothetical protein
MESKREKKRVGIENTENWYALALAVLCGYSQKRALNAMKISTREPVYGDSIEDMKEEGYGRVCNL